MKAKRIVVHPTQAHLTTTGHSRIPNALSRELIASVTEPRPGAMSSSEQAACLWWASLSARERERLHDAAEARELGAEAPLEPRWQIGRLTGELWGEISRWGWMRDRISAAVDTAIAECRGDHPTAIYPMVRVAYRWWADLSDSDRCDAFVQCCPDWEARFNRPKAPR